ncbi:MAG: mitochondrial fission ELM1 family protein [Dongiaceae bacterium]
MSTSSPRQAKHGTAMPAPSLWLLLGDKAGDNGQVLALARALGWPYEMKALRFNERYRESNARLGASLASLDPAASSPLAAPWPDLVIGVGRRSVPIARWIRAQSGGRSRLVQLGRPRLDLRELDLVITTPQYALPPSHNVLQLSAPLNRIAPEALDQAAAAWRERLAGMPAPFIAVMVGGAAGRYAFDADAASALAAAVEGLRRETGGSLLVTTSRRTPDEFADRLFAGISDPACRHRWNASGGSPYAAFLALAERIVVTGDSASMLAEATALGKPVHLFDPPSLAARWSQRIWDRWDPAGSDAASSRPLHRILDFAVRRGILRPSRSMAALHRGLLAEGKLHRLGESAPMKQPHGQGDPEMDRAVARIHALFDR